MNPSSFLFSLLLLVALTGCKNQPAATTSTTTKESPVTQLSTSDYNLYLPAKAEQVLILFPGGGTVAKDIEANFDIVTPAPKENVALLLMNFNRHLWITPDDCVSLTTMIQQTLKDHQLNDLPIVLGGMSIGGTVAVTLGNYWGSKKSLRNPAGVFIVDSPLDLYMLYENALFDTKRTDLDDMRLGEPRWIVNYFTESFGKVEDELLVNIQQVSPLTYATKNTENIAQLKTIPMRFYTEPDAAWWTAHRKTEHERTNAHMLQQWDSSLRAAGWSQLELIQTKDKGYRANGERHPHSWSIVAVPELLQWIKTVSK